MIKFKIKLFIRITFYNDKMIAKNVFFFPAFSYSGSVCNLFDNLEFHRHYTIFLWEYIYPPQYFNTHTRGNFCQSVPEFNHSQISENCVFNVGLYGILFSILFGTIFSRSQKRWYFKPQLLIIACLCTIFGSWGIFFRNLYYRRLQSKGIFKAISKGILSLK